MKIHKNKTKTWVVKGDRPEELLGKPELYYTEQEIEKYSRSGGMRRAQQKIAFRILELLKLKKGKLLDLGCGVGYTTEIYKQSGFNVIGLDILPKMLDVAKKRKLKVVLGDMRNLKKLFKKNEFNAVVSASALQWLKARKDLQKVTRGIYYVLKNKGKIIIQFYPKSEQEMMQTARVFKNSGFHGKIIIDNPDNSKKRLIFLVMEKSDFYCYGEK